jgi:hypothetical protein
MIRSPRKPLFESINVEEGWVGGGILNPIDSVCFQHLAMRQCSIEKGKVDNLSLGR